MNITKKKNANPNNMYKQILVTVVLATILTWKNFVLLFYYVTGWI